VSDRPPRALGAHLFALGAAPVAGALLVLAACPPPAMLPSGCGKDTDCKGTRICLQHACVEAPRAALADGGAADLKPGDAAQPRDAAEAPRAAAPLGPSAQFHGDPSHTGRSRFRAPIVAPREIMHVATGGVVYSAPAIGDGFLAFGSHDRSIYLVDHLSHTAGGADDAPEIRWRRPTGDLVWCAPALAAGVMYVGSDDDHLYALDLADGTVRWQYHAGPCRNATAPGPEGARCDVDGVTVANDGTIYAAADGLYALAPDGSLKWKFASSGPGGRAAHCTGAPTVSTDGSTIYVGCQDDTFYAVASDGTKRWDFRTGDDVDGAAAVGADGTVYFGSDDRKLYALSPEGQVRFQLSTGGAIRSSPAIGTDGTVYVGSFDGSLYATRPNGAVAFTFRTADRILSSPTIDAAGVVLIGSEDDRLYAVGPDGRLVWSVLLDGDVDGTPVIGADGTIYVGVDDRALHGLK
jgi:outer membrane protein assembly factor BamB